MNPNQPTAQQEQTIEQLEYQRKNPHLFTTLTQSVNIDGSITTLYQVTRKLRGAIDKLRTYHEQKFGEKNCNALCMYANNDMCKMIAMYQSDIDKAATSFAEHYKMFSDRRQRLNQLLRKGEE